MKRNTQLKWVHYWLFQAELLTYLMQFNIRIKEIVT